MFVCFASIDKGVNSPEDSVSWFDLDTFSLLTPHFEILNAPTAACSLLGSHAHAQS